MSIMSSSRRRRAGAYPIKPLRAAWFHLIPILWLVLGFKSAAGTGPLCEQPPWKAPLMKPDRTGLAVFHRVCCVSCGWTADYGMILLLLRRHRYLFALSRFALAARPQAPEGELPSCVNTRSEESKCKEGYAGSYHFA